MSDVTFHFKPEVIHLLKWFKDSPDTGDPACVCSYCAEVIKDDGEIPLRVFREDNTELRLHMFCARQVVIELAPKPTVQELLDRVDMAHRSSPAFAEGQAAYVVGTRRGSNPYSGNPNRKEWFMGWDDAWDEAHAESQD